MAWPFSRLRTYTAGSQVPSSDLNALQDEDIARRNRTIQIPAVAFRIIVNLAPTFSYGGSVRTAAGSSTLNVQLDLSPWIMPGDKIKEIIWRWRNGATAAAGTMDASVVRNEIASLYDNGTTVNALAAQNTSTGGASAERTATQAIAHDVLASNIYTAQAEFNPTAAADQVWFGGIALVLGV